ncbi:ankyrin repeat-containing domain protein, partial [Gymnopilus junonius]
KIKNWLSAPDSSRNMNEAYGKLQDGTCSWFFEGEQFSTWKEEPSFLWVKGKGKFLLVSLSSIIHNVDLAKQDSSLSMAYFFFDGRDSQTELQLHHKLIRSLIWQLSYREDHKVPLPLVNLYKKYGHQQPLDRVLRDRSFRWIALQIEELKKCASKNEIQKKLGKLPRGLDETYQRILKGIDRDYWDDTKIFLQFLAFSKRPLKVDELAEVITVDLGSEEGPAFIEDKQYQDPRIVLTRCSSLFLLLYLLNKTSGIIKLSHFSVKEYLLSPMLTKELFMSDAAFTNWVQLWNIDLNIWDQKRSRDKTDVMKMASALYYASLAGIKPTVELLLTNKAEVNAQGGWWGNALQAASAECHRDIVELLLVNKADVNAQGGDYGNALQAASFHGHRDIVELLLQNKAEVNAQGGYHGNALQAASARGYKYNVELLLINEAAVNAEGGYHGNALQAASAEGHRDIVELLLQNKAEVNAQGGEYGNALQAASFHGHRDIVELLLQNKAEVNAQGGEYQNALQAASAGGHRNIVELLLQNKAEVNAQGGYYGNALQAASTGGHRDIVELLLQNKAEVNAQGGYYGNALKAASHWGHRDIVELLLQNKADVNAQGGEYGNALQAASFHGHRDIVELLLVNKAEVNAQGGEYGNALQAASAEGHMDIMELLQEKDAINEDHKEEFSTE